MEETAKDLLEEEVGTDVIVFLEPCGTDIVRQPAKMRRIHFVDTEPNVRSPGIAPSGDMRSQAGAEPFFRALVVKETVTSRPHDGSEPNPSFHRDSWTGKEIDLLIRHCGKLLPVWVKAGAMP